MKTICIYHKVDLDGWMSAAIVKHWFIKENKDCIIFNTSNSKIKTIEDKIIFDNRVSGKNDENELSLLGYNYGDEIPDVSSYDKVIMCDISFPKEEMLKLFNRLGMNFIWIDHHISAIRENVDFSSEKGGDIPIDYNGIRDISFAACELTWKYFFSKPMPEIVRLLGRYDCFGHKGTEEEQKVLEFQYGARMAINNYEEAYKYLVVREEDFMGYNVIDIILDKGKAIYQYLCQEAKQLYDKGFDIGFMVGVNKIVFNKTFTKKREATDYKLYKFKCINRGGINISSFNIDYHKDGYDGVATFSYNGKVWTFSLRSETVDCSIIAKQYGGGGHKGASGFRVDDITEFLKQHKL